MCPHCQGTRSLPTGEPIEADGEWWCELKPCECGAPIELGSSLVEPPQGKRRRTEATLVKPYAQITARGCRAVAQAIRDRFREILSVDHWEQCRFPARLTLMSTSRWHCCSVYRSSVYRWACWGSWCLKACYQRCHYWPILQPRPCHPHQRRHPHHLQHRRLHRLARTQRPKARLR
jgi:hypothetical protein